jgi:MGT family glycosyltransferase
MARYLIVTWDGAGNLLPTLGIARRLVEAGHDVRILGHGTVERRAADLGARFSPLTASEDWDHMDDPDDFAAETELLMDRLCFSAAIADDVANELGREPADAVLVDCMMFSALNVAQASGLPTATLFHTAYTIFRGGPLVEMFAPGLVRLNAQRRELGLDPVTALADVHDTCELALVALPKEFEPQAGDAPNVLRTGPVLDTHLLPGIPDKLEPTDGSAPVVLVSLSTSQQGQGVLLQRIVDVVADLVVRAIVTTGPAVDPATVTAGANTQVVSYLPHTELLPTTSLVITHAGLGTVMAALSHGVPLVCIPMGRDQFFNAERVQTLGAGQMLMPDADAAAIAAAARAVLDDPAARTGAQQLATSISGYGGATDAVTALEGLTAPRYAQRVQ